MEYKVTEDKLGSKYILDGNERAKKLVKAIYNLTGVVIYAQTENDVVSILHNPEKSISNQEDINKLKELQKLITYEEA